MRKVAHPTCDRCGSVNPDYESERFQLRVCYQCIRGIADWLDARGLLEASPFVQELFDGVFSGGTVPQANQYTVVVKSQMHSAFAYKLVERVAKDISDSA